MPLTHSLTYVFAHPSTLLSTHLLTTSFLPLFVFNFIYILFNTHIPTYPNIVCPFSVCWFTQRLDLDACVSTIVHWTFRHLCLFVCFKRFIHTTILIVVCSLLSLFLFCSAFSCCCYSLHCLLLRRLLPSCRNYVCCFPGILNGGRLGLYTL